MPGSVKILSGPRAGTIIQADDSKHDDGGLLHQLYDYVDAKFAASAADKAPATSSDSTTAVGGAYLSNPKAFRDKQIADAGG